MLMIPTRRYSSASAMKRGGEKGNAVYDANDKPETHTETEIYIHARLGPMLGQSKISNRAESLSTVKQAEMQRNCSSFFFF